MMRACKNELMWGPIIRRCFVLPAMLVCLGLSLLPITEVLAESLSGRDDAWLTGDQPGFTVLTNATSDEVGQFVRRAGALRRVVMEANPELTPRYRVPTWLLVFRDESSFAPYMSDSSGRRLNADGLFVRQLLGNYLVVNARPSHDPFPVIYHEYAHGLTDSLFPGMPLWLSEGLAEYYSTLKILGEQITVARPIDQHVAWLREHPLMPLEDLLGMTREDDGYSEGNRSGTFYAQSWATVHYLLRHDPARLDEMARFATLVRDGSPEEEALEEAFGLPARSLVPSVRSYIMRREFAHEALGDVHVQEEVSLSTEEASREDVQARLGTYLAVSGLGREGEAEEHLQGALAIDSHHATAATGLGLLRFKEDRFEDAITLLEGVLAGHEDDVGAATLLGLTLVRRHMATASEERGVLSYLLPAGPLPEDLSRARKLLRIGLSGEVRRGPLLVALGYTFLPEPGEVTEGISALEEASRGLTENPSVKIHLALLYLKAGKRDQAFLLLEDLESRAPEPALGDLALAIRVTAELEAIDELVAEGRDEAARQYLDKLRGTTSNRHMLGILEDAARRLDALLTPDEELERLLALYGLLEADKLDEVEEAARDLLRKARDPEVRADTEWLLGEVATRRAGEPSRTP
jgi:thioredoxin-like negative regulator of GroEL